MSLEDSADPVAGAVPNIQRKHSSPYPSLRSGNGIRDIYGDSAIDHLFSNGYGAKDDEMEM